MVDSLPLRIAITPGEPAGVGPDLVINLAQQSQACQLVAIGDPQLLSERSRLLGLPLTLLDYDSAGAPQTNKASELYVCEQPLKQTAIPGQLAVANGPYVLETLKRGVEGCRNGEFAALVTAPVQKSTIAESGTPFSGHTEFLADACGVDQPVMLLCADTLRVALVTTHLALRDVPAAITVNRIYQIAKIVAADLQRLFGIAAPRIGILGLNPHAGEAGQLGQEEIELIEPAIAKLAEDGLKVSGPLPADSAFTQESLQDFDVILAMYHDQGLPALKHAAFGSAINVTLGLPIIRTSVDHGTALALAGSGRARADSLEVALKMALRFAERTRN